MSLYYQFRSGSLKTYTALYADDSVANVAVAANAVSSTYLLNLLYGLNLVVVFLTVDGNYFSLLELYAQLALVVACNMLQVSLLGQSFCRVENLATADARAPDANIVRVFKFGEVGKLSVSVKIVDLLLARQSLVACKRDNLNARSHDEERHVETYLVVARSR